MSKRNLTVQLDEDLVGRVRVVAARRGTSVSQLVTVYLTEVVDADERYRDAEQVARRMMADAAGRGAASWRRDELHDR